ncbi:type II and III secretion system protein family protein [Stakelama saccharophila]|uniref:Type II and III secretion system protein family protein n=1 Tax=Stakelama saccharophila TaxID=3075605 RepID=A0ABZ0B7D1_9SPHN|nr:type II and III secretion system protein family protein [Stakelama sp. W311]WNO53330.1 type II and III secretion system protein family protein [Stakelama sp. W311]
MRMKLNTLRLSLALATTAAAIGAATPAAAQNVRPEPDSVVQLDIGRGRLVTLTKPMSDLFVADDKVADVQVRSPTQLYIFAKGPGETNVYATSKSGDVVYATTVRVGQNINSVQSMLRMAMPEAHITATPMNGMMLLTGTVANPDDAADAQQLVQAFVGENTKVLTRLRTATPLQVNLQVRVAEVSRSLVKNIGNNLLTQDRTGGFLFGIGSGRSAGSIDTDPDTGGTTYNFDFGGSNERTTLGFAGHLLGLDLLSALDLGERNGQVSTLANPNLTALSGETATFLAGGEIPIPISQGLGAVSVEYKQYGVSLSYTPTVLADGRISLRVRPEVSELDYANAVDVNGTNVPGLKTRRTETTVELGSGQSFMIAGLLSNTHNNSFEGTPGIGNLPVLGALFRSNAFQRSETELVIVITPYLVKPTDSRNIALPTDGYQAPTDLGRVLLGQVRSQSDAPRPQPTTESQGAASPSLGAAGSVPPGPAPQQPVPKKQATTSRAEPTGQQPQIASPGFSIQ